MSIKKVVGICLIISIVIIGYFVSTGLIIFRQYYAHIGYCSKITLPYMPSLIFVETWITTFLLALYTYEECFNKYKKYRNLQLSTIMAFLANLVFMTVIICVYPKLIEKVAFLSADSVGPVKNHPLAYISGVYSVIGLWWNLKFGRKSFKKNIYIITYIIIVSCLIVTLLAVKFAKYEECFG